MMHVRGWNRTRFVGWRPAIMAMLLLALVSCATGRRHQTKQRNAALAANRYQLGWRYFQDGEVRRSLGEFLESVRLEPRNAYYQNSLGQAYLFLSEYDLAEEHCRKAIKLNPALSDAHQNLALVLSERGDYDGAEASYLAALQDPAYRTPEKVYLNWGGTLKKKGDLVGAEEKMRKAVELNPRYAHGHRELGRLLEEKGDDDGALDSYLKAYAGMSEVPELNLKIGELYLQRDQPEQARRFLQKVLDTAPLESSEARRAQAFLREIGSE